MKITVHTIVRAYCSDWEATEVDVLGIFLDENEAREYFETQKQNEIKLAEECGWEIDYDEMYLVAYEDGNYNNNFVHLIWRQKEFEI